MFVCVCVEGEEVWWTCLQVFYPMVQNICWCVIAN